MNNLKKIRNKAGLTQMYLSSLININVRSYQSIELGKSLPRVDRALAIAKILNTTVEELFGKDK
ncbi:XRE family transcriptional regulator [Candidatus Arthromitus sp. SFB-mouse-Japan]|nr:XRE family transcriptional regulator [Candidatus Arthromitus sp. SFB-mouse-Japan]